MSSWSLPGRTYPSLFTFSPAHHGFVRRLTVSTGMSDDDFSLSLETFKYLVLNVHNLVMWLPAFCLAVLLRVITHKWQHQLIFPICQSQVNRPMLTMLHS